MARWALQASHCRCMGCADGPLQLVTSIAGARSYSHSPLGSTHRGPISWLLRLSTCFRALSVNLRVYASTHNILVRLVDFSPQLELYSAGYHSCIVLRFCGLFTVAGRSPGTFGRGGSSTVSFMPLPTPCSALRIFSTSVSMFSSPACPLS